MDTDEQIAKLQTEIDSQKKRIAELQKSLDSACRAQRNAEYHASLFGFKSAMYEQDREALLRETRDWKGQTRTLSMWHSDNETLLSAISEALGIGQLPFAVPQEFKRIEIKGKALTDGELMVYGVKIPIVAGESEDTVQLKVDKARKAAIVEWLRGEFRKLSFKSESEQA